MTTTLTTTTTTRRPRPTAWPTRRPRPGPRPTRSPNQVHQMIIPINNGQFKSCSADTFTMGHDDQPKLPPITVKSFFMPMYGAGREGPHYFDPSKNYMGIIIMAIHSKGKWYTEHSKPFITRNFNPTTKRYYPTSIRPGYILMHDVEYLKKNYNQSGTMHSKLLQDFTGKDIQTLAKENTFYIGWGFSYQEISQYHLYILPAVFFCIYLCI